ncbi:hypothetical protein [Pseudonocardia sp. TRM90224]|uniref:hypothetical protein n=1 Tax=Pseudonocardia sp. TRM90224 TaxID=2812678 RepID=UPI001E309164|nr:hypothetical protein [Pseudonocardia sp. TRM90224]
MYTTIRLLKWEMARNPMAVNTAPSSMAERAERMSRSRSRPAGNAMPAWNTAQIVTIQKASPRVQPCTACSVFAAAP